MMSTWMIRCDGGRLYDVYKNHKIVSIAWPQIAAYAKPNVSRQELAKVYADVQPTAKKGTIVAGVSQVWRFVNEIQIGDLVISYSPKSRTYLLGTVASAAKYTPNKYDASIQIIRAVNWSNHEFSRDQLSKAAQKSLGSTLTVFKIATSAAEEIKGYYA